MSNLNTRFGNSKAGQLVKDGTDLREIQALSISQNHLPFCRLTWAEYHGMFEDPMQERRDPYENTFKKNPDGHKSI